MAQWPTVRWSPCRHPTTKPQPAAPARHATPQDTRAARRHTPLFNSWRTALEQHRGDLIAEFAERAQRSTRAEADLFELQPALPAARAAWRPYQQPINQLEDELRCTLRPAMWKANYDALRAGFGTATEVAQQAPNFPLGSNEISRTEGAELRTTNRTVTGPRHRLDIGRPIEHGARRSRTGARPIAGLSGIAKKGTVPCEMRS